jgi:predicted aspartyl protease
MSGPKRKVQCLQCNTLKGISAFKGGLQPCGQCRRVQNAVSIVKDSGMSVVMPQTTFQLPPIGDLTIQSPVTSDVIMTEEKKEEESHLIRCERFYRNFIKEHPNEFHEGDHITIIDHENVPRKFGSYEEAVSATRKLAQGRDYFYAEYLHEDDVLPVYNIITGVFKGGRMSQVAYVDVKIKNSEGEPHEHKIQMLVDTGALPCVISSELAREMKVKETANVRVGAGGGIVHGKLIEIDIKVGEWEYKSDLRTIMIPGGDSNLLGLSYLKFCHQIWHGDQSLKIRLLGEDEKADIEMGPHLLESMEKLNLNLHSIQTEKDTLETQVQNFQAKSKINIEEIRQLRISLIAAEHENNLLSSVLKDTENEVKQLKSRRKI